MKKIFLGFVAAFFAGISISSAAVISWPAPTGEPLFEDYQLAVDGKSIPVYACLVSAVPFNQIWPGYQRPLNQTELAGFACWDMDSPVSITIESRTPVKSCIVRPQSLAIQPTIKGNQITFSLQHPWPIVVEINDPHHVLHLFASEPEKAVPSPNASGVHYFGPGVHRPGIIELKSHESLYIAGGAVVYGSVHAKDATNIKVAGRGVLDVSWAERGKGGGAIKFSNCSDVAIEGIVMRDSDVWCCNIFGCNRVKIHDVKLVGLWRYNSDGIDICNSTDVMVADSFVRSFDDSLVVKGLREHAKQSARNITFRHCVTWCDWGKALKIGTETCAPDISDVTFEDCDVIRTTHAAMNIFAANTAEIRNTRFANIRVEIDDHNPRGKLQKAKDEVYPADQPTDYCPLLMELIITRNYLKTDPGNVRDVVFKNISVRSNLQPPSRFRGFDAAHTVSGVKIENVTFNGQRVRNAEEAKLKSEAHVEKVEFVEKAQ